MTSTTTVTTTGPPDEASALGIDVAADRPGSRLIGPDVVRAVALIGVVFMNYYGYLSGRGGEVSTTEWGQFLASYDGPLATRFAATFVLTAGVGTTLLTAKAGRSGAAVAAKRWTLIRRGLLLYGFGLIAYDIWPGSILPYYGGMFFVAAFLFTLPTLALAAIGLAAALAGAAVNWWFNHGVATGASPSWIRASPLNSPRQLLIDLFVNGTHPLLPWLTFFCAGMIVGRLLRTDWWKPLLLGVGTTLIGLAWMLSDALNDGSTFRLQVFSTHPIQEPGRGLLYTMSALGAALVGFVVIYAAAMALARTTVVDALAHAGQMTLTLYIAHIVVFNYVVAWQSWVRPVGLDGALVFTGTFWLVAIVVASLWHRRFGIGPLEWLYRKLSA